MTINLTANITFPNINRWKVLAFDVAAGRVTIRCTSPGDAQWIDILCQLSDTANASTGIMVNPSPQHWDDKVISVGPGSGGSGGVGAANSLTNAQNAYRGTANHNAGLRAVEVQGVTDGWVTSGLAGA